MYNQALAVTVYVLCHHWRYGRPCDARGLSEAVMCSVGFTFSFHDSHKLSRSLWLWHTLLCSFPFFQLPQNFLLFQSTCAAKLN